MQLDLVGLHFLIFIILESVIWCSFNIKFDGKARENREKPEEGGFFVIISKTRFILILIKFIRAMISGQCVESRHMELRSKRKPSQQPLRPLRHSSSSLRMPATRKEESQKHESSPPPSRKLKEPVPA